MDRREVIADINSLAENIAQVAVLDAPAQVPLEDDLLKYIIQADLIAAHDSRREPQVEARGEILINFLVCTRCAVVAFIRDDHVEIIRSEPVQAPHKALHTGDDHLLPAAGIGGDLKSNRAIVILGGLPN